MRPLVILLLSAVTSIAHAQNVGINNPNPQYPLHLLRTGPALTGTALNIHSAISGQQDQAGYIRFTNTTNNDASDQFSSYIGGGRGLGNTCYLVFGTSPEGFPPVERMRVTGAGRLGIGTIDPQAQLHTTGDARFDGGILLPTTGGTPASLNHYEETTATVNFFNGPTIFFPNYTVKIVRVGKQVTITFPADNIAMLVSGVEDIVVGPFDPRFMPASNIYAPLRIRTGGINGMGICWFPGNNHIFIKPNANGGNWGGVLSGIYSTSITYSIQ